MSAPIVAAMLFLGDQILARSLCRDRLRWDSLLGRHCS